MLATMGKVRLVLSVDDEIRDAIRLEAALQGKDMAEVFAEMVEKHQSDALAQIRKRRSQADKTKRQKE